MYGLLGFKCQLGLLRPVMLPSTLYGHSIYSDSSSVHAKPESGQVPRLPHYDGSN